MQNQSVKDKKIKSTVYIYNTTYSTSNAVVEWLLVVKMLETEIHLFHNSAIPYSAEYSFPQLTQHEL